MRSHRSCRLRCISIASTALLLVTAGPAGAWTWQVAYDASLGTKPSAQGFDAFVTDPLPDDGLDESNYTVGGGLLIQGETGGANLDQANTQGYELTSADFDFDHDVIEVEFRLRIISATESPPPGGSPYAGFAVSVADRQFNELIAYVGASGAFIQAPPFGTLLAAFDATDGLHDYRLRVGPKRATLERDGVELALLERDDYDNLSAATLNRVAIGDLSPLGRSSSELASFAVRRISPPVAEVRAYQVLDATSATNSVDEKSVERACPAGTRPLGGGVSTDGGPDVAVSESYPGPGSPPTGWVGSAGELVPTGASWDVTVDVICGEVSGYSHLITTGASSTDAVQTEEQFCPGPILFVLYDFPFSGGLALGGAIARQTMVTSTRLWPAGFGPRWRTVAEDFGVGTSVAPWNVSVHALCSDATPFELEATSVPSGPGSLKQASVNCRGGKLPVSGGANVFNNVPGRRIEWSRPKDGAPGAPPVGWEAQGRSTGDLGISAGAACLPLADPTVSANGLKVRLRGEFDAEDSWGWAHATLLGGVTFGTGVDGAAFEFDGDAVDNDQWVEVPSQVQEGFDLIDLYPEGDFTVAAWIRTSATPGDFMTIVQLNDLGGPSPLGFNTSFWGLLIEADGHLQARFRSATLGGVQFLDGTAALNDGAWHHVALSRDLLDYELRLFVDGVEVDQATLAGAPSDQALYPGAPGFPDPVAIGAWRESANTGITNEFEGLIDEVSYWDRALRLDEIQNLAGCHRMLSPRVLNLDADRFSSPAGAGHTLCVYLEAGSHELTLVDPSSNADARFTAWSSGPSGAWGTQFSVEPEIDAGFLFGLPVGASSPDDAFASTTDKDVTLTLSQAQRVYVSLVDSPALDNRGGVSIEVPEPGGASALVLGCLLLRVLACRSLPKRRRNGTARGWSRRPTGREIARLSDETRSP